MSLHRFTNAHTCISTIPTYKIGGKCVPDSSIEWESSADASWEHFQFLYSGYFWEEDRDTLTQTPSLLGSRLNRNSVYLLCQFILPSMTNTWVHFEMRKGFNFLMFWEMQVRCIHCFEWVWWRRCLTHGIRLVWWERLLGSRSTVSGEVRNQID